MGGASLSSCVLSLDLKQLTDVVLQRSRRSELQSLQLKFSLPAQLCGAKTVVKSYRLLKMIADEPLGPDTKQSRSTTATWNRDKMLIEKQIAA